MSNEAPFRIAFRDEGEFVNCYFAERHTMEGATLLGSMRKTILDNHPELYTEWRLLMSNCFREMLGSVMEKVLGKKIDVDDIEMREREAPESERTGNA